MKMYSENPMMEYEDVNEKKTHESISEPPLGKQGNYSCNFNAIPSAIIRVKLFRSVVIFCLIVASC